MEINIKKMPFELIINRVKRQRRNIVCQRYFKVKKADLSKAKTLDFVQLFSSCVQMIQKAIAEASSAFLYQNSYVYYVNDMSSLSPTRYSPGDIIYISSEDGFYEYVNGFLEKITNDGRYWVFAPLKNEWRLSISLYYHQNGVIQKLSEESIDVSSFPRYIASKIDLTGKRKHWEHAHNLIYDIIHIIYVGLSPEKVKHAK